MAVRARWAVVATLLAGVLFSGTSFAGGETTTGEVPARRPEPTAVIRTSSADTAVQVNVDIGMKVRAGQSCSSRFTGACKGAVYHPCFNPHDPAYRGCQQYTFYRVIPPGTDLSKGIAIDSATGALNHGWGRKITEAHLEVYAVDPMQKYGDVRIRVDGFPHSLPGLTSTAYSDEIGHINLPLAGTAGTGSISGVAVGPGGRPMPPRSFKLDVFGRSDTARHTGVAGEGAFLEYGFGGARVEDGVRDGSFATRPLFTGSYDIHVQRRGASYSCRVKVAGALRFDLDFSKDRLGHPGCEPLRPLDQSVPG